MVAAIQADRTPNLLVMQYSPIWQIKNLLLIPRFFLSETAIEKRKPLAPTAVRKGWVGCNILLSRISAEGKIVIVTNGIEAPPTEVRRKYQHASQIQSLRVTERGWALDVLASVRSLGVPEFSLSDAYSFEAQLSVLHPANRNVRAKIRQQLQVLRDRGFLTFTRRGCYQFV